MTPRHCLISILLVTALVGDSMPRVWAQGEMSFTEEEAAEDGESLFEELESKQKNEAVPDGANTDWRDVTDRDVLGCAAGFGCEGLGVSRDDAVVLTGHETAEGARKAYQEQYENRDADSTEQVSDKDPSADENRGGMSFTEDEVFEDGESLFDELESEQGNEPVPDGVRTDWRNITDRDALGCAAGFGCEGLGVSQDDAVVLTGHENAEDARKAYREQYGNADADSTEQDLSVDGKRGEMSFTEDEVTEDGAKMSFTEEEVQDTKGQAPTEERFTDAGIASFSQEEDELWACTAGFGCKGAAVGLTPHEALHRLGLPEYSYKWPLAACATSAPGACEEMGISLKDALRIMSHLANPNR